MCIVKSLDITFQTSKVVLQQFILAVSKLLTFQCQYLQDGVHKNYLNWLIFRLDALAKALSVIATATWLGGWVVAGCLSQPVLYQND